MNVPQVTGNPTSFSMASGEVRRVPPNANRIALYLWNTSNSDCRLAWGSQPRTDKGPVLYAQSGDEFSNNTQELFLTPDAGASGTVTVEVYEEFLVQ